MAEHHLGAIDFELSKFKNKSRIEGYRAAYFKDDEHHSGSMTFVFRGPLEPVVYARYPYEEEMMFEVGYIGFINDEISFRPYKKLPYVGRYTAEKVTEMMNEDSFKPDPNELGRVRCFIHKQKKCLHGRMNLDILVHSLTLNMSLMLTESQFLRYIQG